MRSSSLAAVVVWKWIAETVAYQLSSVMTATSETLSRKKLDCVVL